VEIAVASKVRLRLFATMLMNLRLSAHAALGEIQCAILQIEADAVAKRDDVVEVVSVRARGIRTLHPADETEVIMSRLERSENIP
jgi:hypothetical protein